MPTLSRLRLLAAGLKQRAADVGRAWHFRSALRSIDASRAGARLDDRVLGRLIKGWGNRGWSADHAYLRGVSDYFASTSGSVLECGSGLTTVLMGSLASAAQRRVIALEHQPAWAARVQHALHHRVRDRVHLVLTGLRSYGEYDWYDVGALRLPNDIGLVICDGPPADTRGGRYGALPVLAPHLRPGCVVLLDDSQRPEERNIIERWRAEFGLAPIADVGTFSALRFAGA